MINDRLNQHYLKRDTKHFVTDRLALLLERKKRINKTKAWYATLQKCKLLFKFSREETEIRDRDRCRKNVSHGKTHKKPKQDETSDR